MQIDICDVRTGKELCVLNNIAKSTSISDIKKKFEGIKPKYYVDRQAFKLDPKGKMLKDSDTLDTLGLCEGQIKAKLLFRDLGPQIGWSTVFLCEYAGPIFAYGLFYARPTFIYGASASKTQHWVVHWAMMCWFAHYAKRLLETIFVHRFSHATMPIMNLFKNCSYYWGFAAFVSYFVNHPLYTPAYYGITQIYVALGLFIFAELGNFSIHIAFRNMRPAGSNVRMIPMATANPLTSLFSFVSCPNYTYEVLAWMSFSVMTQCLPAALFTLAGFYQMTVWAIGKHRNYKREFKDYPRGRKAIIPFIV